MANKSYWDNFYLKDSAPHEESSFARFCYEFINNGGSTSPTKLLDVACGNGRDTFYFLRKGFNASGVDLSALPDAAGINFYSGDILCWDYNSCDVLYLRFIVHSLTENELDVLLGRIASTVRRGVRVFIETRSSRGITDQEKSETFFKSGVGEEHFRMLYSSDYLRAKLARVFDVIYESEANGVSVYKGEDPYCLRFVLLSK